MAIVNIDAIRDFIASNDIPFVATQQRLCVPIIARMCQKMSYGIRFDEIKVCGNMIIDGHHRYLSALIMNVDLGQVKTQATSATQQIGWDLVDFDNNDWDTPAKIAHLNELDAKYNNLDLDFVNRITSV